MRHDDRPKAGAIPDLTLLEGGSDHDNVERAKADPAQELLHPAVERPRFLAIEVGKRFVTRENGHASPKPRGYEADRRREGPRAVHVQDIEPVCVPEQPDSKAEADPPANAE